MDSENSHEYKCSKCSEKLSSKVELFHHTRTVHVEKKHCCSHCGLKFLLTYTLENHIEKEHFAHIFGKLTTPYGMFEWQKTQILIAHQKQTIGRPKKVPLAAKKSSARD